MAFSINALKKLDFIRRRRRAYQSIGQDALIDLARFCRANQTCFRASERETIMLEGRREVWLRIQQHLNLSSEQLFALYGAHQTEAE